ncbi:hypothetical protein ACFV2N_26665 [Streptomyces sp. NPDC059680]|uniref:hypothetical protein n=1 Tax=Streptomyces sp. NPDC059680 TaxID=3346904 RepID=UPI0036A240E5
MTDGEAQYGADGGDHVDFRGGVFTGPVAGKDIHHHYYGTRRPTDAWPHQEGVIPPRACCFQTRAEVFRLREALGTATAFTDLLPHVGRVLGEDHPRTLNTQQDLAYWQGQGNS